MITLIMSKVHFIPSVRWKMVIFNEYSAFKSSFILDIFLSALDSWLLTAYAQNPFKCPY